MRRLPGEGSVRGKANEPLGKTKGRETTLMSVEENKALFRRTYEELLNGGDLSVADQLVAPDFVNHEAPPGRDRGPESMRGLAVMLRTAFPDLHFEIEELVAEGDVVAGRLTMSGTHEGPLMGTPPTGRSVRQEHMHFVRFKDGKAMEHWGVRDDLDRFAM
jgi:predicted ester cyclase